MEALRLYPPFWMIDREAVADDRVGDLAIPRGSTVIVYVYGAHHAPRYWQNPESFDPERFTKANEKLHTPFTHLPFGGGPRGCIGGNYAMLQILMILSDLLRRYDFQLTPGQTIEARPMVILRPKHGIRMTFTEAVSRGSSNSFRLSTPPRKIMISMCSNVPRSIRGVGFQNKHIGHTPRFDAANIAPAISIGKGACGCGDSIHAQE